MRDRFLISRDKTVNSCWHDASITLSYLFKCVSCARRLSSFDVLLSVVLHAPFASSFPRSFLEVSRCHVGGNRVSC